MVSLLCRIFLLWCSLIHLFLLLFPGNHCHNEHLGHFHHPPKFLCTSLQSIPPSTLATDLELYIIGDNYINNVLFFTWLFSLGIIILIIIHVAMCGSRVFLSITEQCSIVSINHICLCTHLWWTFGSFPVLSCCECLNHEWVLNFLTCFFCSYWNDHFFLLYEYDELQWLVFQC